MTLDSDPEVMDIRIKNKIFGVGFGADADSDSVLMDSNSELNDLVSGLRGIRCGTDAKYLGRKGGK